MKYSAPPADIRGLRSGKLVAVEPTEVRIRKRIMWRCACGRAKFNGVTTVAHRAIYQMVKGDIPDGLNLLHRCDNPPCCNPDHLFPGTQKQNCEDAVSKDRHCRGERNGVSKLTDDDVRFIRANASIMSQMDLARRFDIQQSSIWSIINRRQWKHVQD